MNPDTDSTGAATTDSTGHYSATAGTHPSATWDSAPLDLSAYLDRIGYEGPLTPGLETLSALQHAHLEAIPFESLDPVLGRPVRIDIHTLQDKLVRRRRGGYCHEHNVLFASVLDRLGFEVTGRNARMLMGQDEREIGPLAHTILSVTLDGTDWHVDVGIGSVGPRGPVPLEPGTEVDTGPWRYRIERTDLGHWLLRLLRPDGWFNLVQFTEEPFYRADFAEHNYLASHEPGSPFTRQVIAQYNGWEVRRSLVDLVLTTHRPGAEQHKVEIIPEEIPETLRSVFGLHLPEEHERALVERVRTSAGVSWNSSESLLPSGPELAH